ncbi:neutral zinc metallopeptidase [Escherichia coli]
MKTKLQNSPQVILATAENAWGQQFEKMGKTYQQPKLVMYRE